MLFDLAEATRLAAVSTAAHHRLMGAVGLVAALHDHLSPAARRASEESIKHLKATYEAAAAASVEYPRACQTALSAALDKAEQAGGLFAVVAVHEGSDALPA